MLGKGVAALPLAERLKNATQVAQILKAHPMIGALAKVGLTALRQAGVGGAQTYVKTGGDAGAAATTAAVTGGTGAVLGAAGEGISSAIASRAPTIENVGGVPTTVTREAQNLKPTPQQVQGQQAIRGTAQNAAGAHLAEVNESRAVPTNAPALPASNGPYEFNLRGVTPVEGQTGTLLHPAAKFEPTASRVPEGGEPGTRAGASETRFFVSARPGRPARLRQSPDLDAQGRRPGRPRGAGVPSRDGKPYGR